MTKARDKIRILIADDHQMFCDALRNLIDFEPGLQVVGQATNGHEAVRMTTELKPDLVLLDLSMPLFSGLDVLCSRIASA